MNYLEIVLHGYFNKNNREFLDSYFFEEFKKAEKEHFCNADKFFNGCLDITKYWTKYLNKLVLEHKREMYFMLNEAKKYNLKYDEKKHKSLEQNRKETIEYCEQELNNLNIFNYSINLSSIKNGGIPYNLQYNEVLFIENAILQAYEKTQSEIEHLPPSLIKTKAEVLNEQLSQYGFFELEKVKILSEKSKFSIIEKIAEKGLPYAIAMFDYLGFISFLEKKHFNIKNKLNSEVSKWFDSDKEGRAVKGNISSLLKNTNENKKRYTAYKHKENVILDYKQLK